MFGVEDAATKMQQARALGSIHMSGELPASITRESRYHQHVFHIIFFKTACIYIINDKTVAFIPTRNGITVFDSHYNGTSGAFLAMAPADAAWELLSWFKAINNIPRSQLGHSNMCYIPLVRR